MDNYKGYYLNHHSDLHSFEGGAHFKYSDLCYNLEKLARTLPKNRLGDDYVIDTTKKENIPFSRNAKRIIKSYSQKQLENIEGYDYNDDYPKLNKQQPNSKENPLKSAHHPRTQSEDLNSKNDLININFIINKYEACMHNNKPQTNPKMFNSTRNSLGLPLPPGISHKTNNSNLQQNKFLLPIPSTTSYSTKNMFAKKTLNNKKAPCSLIKVYSNNASSSMNDIYINNNNNELSCLDDNNCGYINDKMDDCYNKLIKLGPNKGNTIIIKPQINFSFVNNVNAINIQPPLNESRNKPNESINFSKKNFISISREGNDGLMSNMKSSQMLPLKKTASNFDIANAYGYKLNKFKQLNQKASKCRIPIKKSPNKLQTKKDNTSQANFFMKSNSKADAISGLPKKLTSKEDIAYQPHKDIFSIGGSKSSVNNNCSSVTSTRNLISFQKNMSDYPLNRYKMGNYLSKK